MPSTRERREREESPVNEIAPGLFDWTTFHEGIQQDVDSYFVESQPR
jgi:hypothetical protein